MIVYYGQRASASLIVTEATAVSEGAQGYWRTPGVYSLKQIAGWEAVSEAVHKGGARIFMQLWHNGRMFHPDNVPWQGRSVAPSAVAPKVQMMTSAGRQQPPEPETLTVPEIHGIVADFALGARNAMLAGMDGIELHAANGYIFEQFLHRSSNWRDDAYGGSLKNRARLLLEVVGAVSDAIGPDRVGVRISPYGILNDMSDPEQHEIYQFVAEAMNETGIAYLHIIRPVVSGNQTRIDRPADPDPLPEIRERYKGPLIVAGAVDVAVAEALIDADLADAVAFGRWFVSNPDLPERIRNGWPLAEYDAATFYTPGPTGYVDYPPYGLPG
jgi:N-ethylmaleimide reductase